MGEPRARASAGAPKWENQGARGQRRSTKMGGPKGQSQRRSTKMGEPRGQGQRRSTKMGEPMGQGQRRSTKMGEPIAGHTPGGQRRSTKKLKGRQHPLQHPLFGEKLAPKWENQQVLASAGAPEAWGGRPEQGGALKGTKMGDQGARAACRSTKMTNGPMGRSTKMGAKGQSQRRSTKMGEPMGQGQRRSTKMGEPMGQGRRRSTKMGEPMGQGRRRSTKMGEPMGQRPAQEHQNGRTNGPGPAQEHQNGRTNGPGPAQEHQNGRTSGPGPAQEHQNGRTIASATHQGAGAGFPKLKSTAPLTASAVWGKTLFLIDFWIDLSSILAPLWDHFLQDRE